MKKEVKTNVKNLDKEVPPVQDKEANVEKKEEQVENKEVQGEKNEAPKLIKTVQKGILFKYDFKPKPKNENSISIKS